VGAAPACAAPRHAALRAALVASCAAPLFRLLDTADTAALAHKTLRRLGFPADWESLRSLGADDPAHLPIWWLHDASLRKPPAAAAAAAAAAAGQGDDEGHDAIVCVSPAPPSVVLVQAQHFDDFRYGPILQRLCVDHPSLSGLRFERCSFSEAFCEQLPDLLASHHQLSSLSFHGPPETSNAVRRHDSWPSAAASAAVSFGHRASGHGPLWAAGPTAAFDEALAFLPTEIPTSVTTLHFDDGAISRAGVRVLGAALHSFPSLRSLSLAHSSLRAADLTPLFSLLQAPDTLHLTPLHPVTPPYTPSTPPP
jgi:hypothetical protein|tara:strand:+ start:71 stop:1000 length:930 start_codon:yes stop_codon:yes gene_type:complete